MKPHLLFDRYDETPKRKIDNENDMVKDLNLDVVFDAMAQGDPYLHMTARNVVLDSLTDIDAITYRQNVLKDSLDNKLAVTGFYNIASDVLQESAYYRQANKPSFSKMVSVSYKIRNSAALLELLVVNLERLKSLTGRYEKQFSSKGLLTFWTQLQTLLPEPFFLRMQKHIEDLKFISEGGKIIIGSQIGIGLKGTGHILRSISGCTSSKSNSGKKNLGTAANNEIPLDNIRLVNNAKEIEDAGLVHILRLINCFNDTILHFFELLRYESGFYLGCINLNTLLEKQNAALSFPVPADINQRNLVFDKLYDLSLFIKEKKCLVSNALDAVNKNLYIVTGANQGGKSTYLRSIGIAQILMQCGLFVPAVLFNSNICDKIFTHFTREEDAGMNSGKLDEELQRMNHVINCITPHSFVLLNEPFATTTERDGSIIASEIIEALNELDVKSIFVTHLFEFSNSLFKRKLPGAVFLRAERNDNGDRTFCINMGQPLLTSYGEDLFNNVIGITLSEQPHFGV